MPKHTSNAEIAASVADAENLLARLDLTPQERAWAKERAKAVFKEVSDALLDSGQAMAELRAITVPASLAYALAISKDWAAKADDLAK